MKKLWYKRLLRTIGISEQSTLLCEKKKLTSRQIFRYAVPARTVTKKHWLLDDGYRAVATCNWFRVFWFIVACFAFLEKAKQEEKVKGMFYCLTYLFNCSCVQFVFNVI